MSSSRAKGRHAALVAAAALAALSPLPAAAEIRVGLAVPLTGRLAPVGLAMRDALEAAVAEANAAGGVLGARLALVVADDGCAGATAEGAAATLLAGKAALVIGHPCSGAATRAARLYGEAGVLLIAVGARHPDVTGAHPAAPVLRLAGRDDRQGEAAARWLLAHAPGRRVAIVHDRTAYARGLVEATRAALEAEGVEPVALLPIVAGRRDYGEAVAEIGAARAEAVLFAGFPDEAAIVVGGLGADGPAIPLLGTDALATPAFAEVARQARTPVQVLLPVEPGAGDSADPDAHLTSGTRARAAFEAWLATVRRIGAADGESTGRALRGASIDTPALGEIRFDGNGDLVGEAFVPASASAGQWVPDR